MGENTIGHLRIDECEEDCLYLIEARGGSVGIARKTDSEEEPLEFVLSRYEFGDGFLFSESHWDCKACGTAKPIRKLERVPDEVLECLKAGDINNEGPVLEYLDEALSRFGIDEDE